MNVPTDPDARLAAVQLARTAQVGPISWRQLVARFGSAQAAIDAIPYLAARGGGRLRAADRHAVAAEMERVTALGADYLLLTDPDYPAPLAAVENAPPVLIIKGQRGHLANRMVAMVGARNASALSCRFARQLAGDLAQRGLSVVSGLARGIDTAAHIGAMAHGQTLAVIASGIDIAFPAENERLQADLAEHQLVITEYPPGTEPVARQFPARNRIIAGLALGTVVVEAALRSGSLITARCAGDYGRHVMAVPGSPLDARAQGCNSLIRDGATLIQGADDVLELVSPFDGRMVSAPRQHWAAAVPAAAEPAEPDAADHVRVAELLSASPVAVDEIVRQAGLNAAVVSTVLLELELAGRITRHAGARVSLA